MLDPGTRLAGRYTVVRALDEGGMGMVYEVREDSLNNRFALKIIKDQHAGNTTLKSRFQREARILSSLSHPAIARVIELLEHDNMPAMVMEYVDGPTLRERLMKSRPPLDVVRKIVTDILSALVAVHSAGIIHRDLKPDNIFVLIDQSNQIRCKIIDFGVARHQALEDEFESPRLTREASFVGTYIYASPEQITLSSAVDYRSDLYSLGVVLWEMLAGVPIYANLASVYAVQKAVVSEPLPSLSDDIPADLRRLVVELTRKAPGERPQSAKEVLGMLQAPRVELSRPARLDEASLQSGGRPALASTVQETGPQARGPGVGAPGVGKGRTSKADLPARGEASPLSLAPAALSDRFMARFRDELIPQLLVLTCVGIVAYPFLMIGRGVKGGQSVAQALRGVQVLDLRTGEPASRQIIMNRNIMDMLLWQIPLLGLTSPLSWLVFPLPLIAGIWFGLVGGLEFALAASRPDGRRIVDFICNTQVCRK